MEGGEGSKVGSAIYTPEVLLELAWEVMPHRTWEIRSAGVVEKFNPRFRFDPLGDDAHAWAVLEATAKEVMKRPELQRVVDKAVEDANLDEHDENYMKKSNLAAAVAVMERVKGERK